MTLSDSDRLLVNDGSETNTITFAQFKDGSVLNPTDLFLVNDGTKTETISWEQIEDELGPKGTVNTPTVLKPKDGAGSGDERFAKTDAIIDIEGGGIITCETDAIESVNVFNYSDAGNWTNLFSNGDKAFDGSTLTFAQAPQGSNTIFTWTYNLGTKAGDTVQFWFGDANNTDRSVSFDGGSTWLKEPSRGEGVEITATGNITEIQSRNDTSAGGSSAAIFAAVAVNGSILKDGTTILTFPSSNGFDCFEPGDVVGGQDFRNSYTLDTNDDPGPEKIGRAFDGDFTTRSSMPVRTTCTVTFPVPIVNVSSIRVYLLNATYAQSKYFKINGVEKGSDITQLTGWNTITSPPATFSSISFGTSADVSTNIAIAAIEVNGRLLLDGNKVISKDEDANTITVDGGDWSDGTSEPGTDQTQVWSKQVSLTPADVQYLSGKGPEMAFNNDFSNYNYTTVQAYAGTSTIRVEFNPSLSGELIVFGDTNLDPVKQTVLVTADTGGGTFADLMTTNVAENTITTVTNCTAIEISQSLAQSPGGVDTQVMLKGIKVGGDILFDASGDTKLVKETPYDTTLTVAGSTDLADMTGSVLMTDGSGAPGPYTQTPYKLVTTDIESVSNLAVSILHEASGGVAPKDRNDHIKLDGSS